MFGQADRSDKTPRSLLPLFRAIVSGILQACLGSGLPIKNPKIKSHSEFYIYLVDFSGLSFLIDALDLGTLH